MLVDHWNHLPHWVRAIILGNVIQGAFVAVVRALAGRFVWLGSLVDRLGPKALRSGGARRTGEGIAAAVGWFALSWYVGHQVMGVQGKVVSWLLRW
jgi:hypothetical protein